MHEGLGQQQKYYFPDILKRQLEKISYYPLTIIEAPYGFGKTTAIREYLKENISDSSRQLWYTCLGESASATWLRICELISNVNRTVADDLKNLKMPTRDTLFYMMSYLKNINCVTETYIVVDNYQLINCDIPHELINVFSRHGNPNLHMIFITQQINARQKFLIRSDTIHLIDTSSFFFDRTGISSLFHMRGIRLSIDQVEDIFMSTEGWIAAIRLQMISYMQTGSFTVAADIEQLVEHAIWNHLDPEEKNFLLSISVLDSFTEHQAALMSGEEVLTENAQNLLKNNDFIRYLPDKCYSIHSILHDYLRNLFYNQTSTAYQNVIYRRAGDACTDRSQYHRAAEFYYKVGCFGEILSLPFTLDYFAQQKEKNQLGFYINLINECPDAILCKYPFTLIVFGYMTLMKGYHNEYQKLYDLIYSVIQSKVGYSKAQLQRINGEFMLLKSMGEFNDINKMQKTQKKCWELLGRPSDIVKTSMPIFFGGVSVLNMLWRESGKLDDMLKYMEEESSLYLESTQGHGAGAYYVILAEVSLMRGNYNEAEVLCHSALYEARSYKQIETCLRTDLILTRIAILRGDVEGYFSAVKRIQDYPKENSSLYVLRMVEYCMSIISLMIDSKDFVSHWFYDMEDIRKTVYAPVVPHAQLIHLLLLMLEKRYNEFYGICQYEIDRAKNSTENAKYVMPQVYRLIFLAVAKRRNGKQMEAQAHLKEALSLALPDRIYLPFAQQECMEDFLSELNMDFYEGDQAQVATSLEDKITDYTEFPPGEVRSIPFRETNSYANLMALCKRQKKGVSVIKKAIYLDRSPLTPREREIALLAKERLTAKEIAGKLYISDMTVKATLRNVYSKLDIHSRAELFLKEF